MLKNQAEIVGEMACVPGGRICNKESEQFWGHDKKYFAGRKYYR